MLSYVFSFVYFELNQGYEFALFIFHTLGVTYNAASHVLQRAYLCIFIWVTSEYIFLYALIGYWHQGYFHCRSSHCVALKTNKMCSNFSRTLLVLVWIRKTQIHGLTFLHAPLPKIMTLCSLLRQWQGFLEFQ